MADKLRIACLGTGGIAAKHANFYRDHAETEIVAGCDVKADIVEGFWNRVFGEGGERPAVYTDAAKMYEEVKPDAVVICTPHTLHFDHAMQALDAGCHVLMEKPMVTDADQAYQLRDKVEQTGKVFVIGYNTPCAAETYYLRELIRNGELGELQLISGYLSQNWRKATVGTWRQKPELSGGGQAYDSGAHLLSTLCWTVDTPIEQVFSFIDNMDTQVDINSAINIKFTNGVMAALCISGDCPTNGGTMVFMFSEGRVDIDGWGASWIKVYKGGQEVKYPPITPDMDAGPPAQNFIDAIAGRNEARTNPTNGIIHSELMDAIYESGETGQVARPKTRV